MSARAEIHTGRKASVADGSTFAHGLRLLAPPVREDVERLYRVLRAIDDLVDEDDPRAPERVGALERWAHGEPADSPETRSLSALLRRRPFPRATLLDFCAGMRHDLARREIETEADFERYCQQAGGSVGIVLASLLGAEADSARADSAATDSAGADSAGADGAEAMRELQAGMATLGRAMQITNILRDIDEDLGHGRLYISREAIERFGFPAPGAREALLREQIARADALYERGAGAIGLLRHGRAAMAVSAALYREILREIERQGFGRTPGRVVVPARRTNALIASARRLTYVEGLTG